jgi:NCS1 family nucleobase:cation symporter-1
MMAVVAAAGYEMVARIANIAAPWMISIFAACGIVSLVQMDVTSLSVIREGKFWSDAIAFVQAENVAKGVPNADFGFWKCVIFAWLCNAAMHFGMADLSIFRFARNPSAGWAPSIGMFLGHYMAWIAAGLLLAAQIKLTQISDANPGMLTWNALGWTGIICVVIAGWTTANPTIYRAGLAFQGVIPGSSRPAITLVAGVVATIAGAFPNLSNQLLGFVGTYGTVLGPMGAVIIVDYYLMQRFGLQDEYACHSGIKINIAVLVAWVLPVSVGLYLIFATELYAAYAVIPCWVACGVLYLVLSKFTQRPIAD